MIFDRTFHPDEANQAFTTGKLLETGVYTYRPTDHHGPTLYYAAAPLQQAFGHTSTATLDGTLLRCTPLVFAVAGLVFLYLTVLRLVRQTQGLKRHRTWLLPLIPVLLVATTPLYVFYATDFIQEMLLVCFTLMMFWAGTGYCLPGRRLKRGTWAILCGIGAGLCFATKETCVLTFAALFGAALPFLLLAWRTRRNATEEATDAPAADRPRTGVVSHLVLAAFGFGIVSLVLFSSFCRDWHGVYNAFIAAPRSYVHRAAGDAASDGAAWHVHPWWQHLVWLFHGNPLAAGKTGSIDHTFRHLRPLAHLLLVLIPVGLLCRFGKRRSAFNQPLVTAFLGTALYALLLLIAYSCIPYKTPWCTLQLAVPYVTAASLGYLVARDFFLDFVRTRGERLRIKLDPGVLAFIFLLFLPASVLMEHVPGLLAINRKPDDASIPYNYAHASPEAKQLAACVADVMAQANAKATAPDAGKPFVAVALPPTDTWPFPFYNRRLEAQTGYWTKFDDLVELQKKGVQPTVVIVPMTEGHMVQMLYPNLKNTRRFFMRPGVRVRVFW